MGREPRTEPEVVLPFLATASGPATDLAISSVADGLRRTSAADNIAFRDPDAPAEVLARLTHSLLPTPPTTRPLLTRAEIGHYCRRHLLPLVHTAIIAPAAAG
jgi:hypothetical protein